MMAEVLDYEKPPPRKTRWSFWVAFFISWIVSLPVADGYGDMMYMTKNGHHHDGGATILAAFGILPVILLLIFWQRRTLGIAILFGFFTVPLTEIAMYATAMILNP